MAEEKQVEELYDFLYRDVNRISSYYSQIYGGRLTALEKTLTDKNAKEDLLGGTLPPFLEADGKMINEIQQGLKSVLDPHDLVTTDVLTFLSQGFCSKWEEAKAGDLILEFGSVRPIEATILKQATDVFISEFISQLTKNSKSKSPEIAHYRSAQQILSKINYANLVWFETDSSHRLLGTLKDGSWEGSASDFCSKHGENHLTNVYLVAIKERSKHFENSTSSEKQPFSDIEKAVGKFLKTVAPSKSNPITPIAIFRKLRKVAQ